VSLSAAAAAANGQEASDAAADAGLGVSTQLLLSGPRLKMGVAAGTPQSVAPDHLGRADYHGHAVNMAAR
jgi:class 3 adenylate cyclase